MAITAKMNMVDAVRGGLEIDDAVALAALLGRPGAERSFGNPISSTAWHRAPQRGNFYPLQQVHD